MRTIDNFKDSLCTFNNERSMAKTQSDGRKAWEWEIRKTVKRSHHNKISSKNVAYLSPIFCKIFSFQPTKKVTTQSKIKENLLLHFKSFSIFRNIKASINYFPQKSQRLIFEKKQHQKCSFHYISEKKKGRPFLFKLQSASRRGEGRRRRSLKKWRRSNNCFLAGPSWCRKPLLLCSLARTTCGSS